MSQAQRGPAPVSEGRRERILAASLEIFAERGFDGATTREIAERAGANHGLIRYYFETKEALWKEAVDRAFSDLRESLGDAIAADDPADGTANEELVRRFVRFVARQPHFMRLMNDEGKRDGPRMRWLVERHVGPMYALLERRLSRSMGPAARAIPAISLHYIVVGAAGLIFSQAPEARALCGADPSEPAAVEAHAEALVRLLFGASGPLRRG